MTRWIAIDTETTGLAPGVHDIWEIGAVTDDGQKFSWLIDDVRVHTAEPKALEVGGFYDRWDVHPSDARESGIVVARKLAKLTAGRHLVGVGISFDAAFLNQFLRRHNRAPAWHYHLIDVSAMALGWLHGQAWAKCDPARVDAYEDFLPGGEPLALPWRSDDLSRACGVEPPAKNARHTALGDAEWAARWYGRMTDHAPVPAQPAAVHA